ncbi:MAG: plasmid pRiA4b ORF-3 family protein, partial [Lachnospiraceae bacterium]|nr:plasmid pRiA4b ORF-3 family protein [Lachnospiraceae bacterium]
MFSLSALGVTPEEYAQFYHLYNLTGELSENLFEGKGDFDDKIFAPGFGNGFSRKRTEIKGYEPLKDASGYTLVLKIQMKGVNKPPMWREVEVPADFNFMQLHDTIQTVTGLEDCHLWQFNKKAYDESLQIGVEMDEDSFAPALDYVTHAAED